MKTFAIATVLALSTLTTCLLYTSDAADERSSVDLGGRRIIKKKKTTGYPVERRARQTNVICDTS